MRRKRVFSYDGYEVTVSPLNFLQADEFLNKPEKTDAMVFAKEMVCKAINNAESDPALAWTVDRINIEMDAALFWKLYNFILEYSGMTLAPGDKTTNGAAAPGEAGAASVN